MQASRAAARLRTSSGSFCTAILACCLTASRSSLYCGIPLACAPSWCISDSLASSRASISSKTSLADLRIRSAWESPGGMMVVSFELFFASSWFHWAGLELMPG